METTNGYVVIYNGKNHDVYAKDLYSAKKQFIDAMKVPKSKQHSLAIMLAEKDVPMIGGKPGKGTQVVHSTAGIWLTGK